MVNSNTRKNTSNKKHITLKKTNKYNTNALDNHPKSTLGGHLYVKSIPLDKLEEVKKRFNLFRTPEKEIDMWMNYVIKK